MTRDASAGGAAAQALAVAAAATSFQESSPAVQERVLAVVRDVVAVVCAGAQRSDVAELRTALHGGAGPCTVVGADRGADPAQAALLNGLAGAAEQLQDGHRLARGHPASHLIPAVFAAAEADGSYGAAFLSAVLAGYEVGAAIGTALGGTLDGVHDIGTWAVVGAAAGVAHVSSGGSAPAIAAAIELAAAVPLLPDAALVFGGASGQHAYLGLACHLAVTWGRAAAAGFEGLPGALERHLLPRLGAAPRAVALTDSIGADGHWRNHAVLDGYLKRHPTCAHLHGVNDAVEALLAEQVIAPDDVDDVDVRTYAQAAAFDDPTPVNELAARFSIPFTVAAAVVDGGLTRDSFRPQMLESAAVAGLSRRVRVRHDPDLDAGYPAGRPAVVTVHLRDGQSFEQAVARPRGDGPTALADPTVAAKPSRLLEPLGLDTASAVLTAVDGLPTSDMHPLADALRRCRGVPPGGSPDSA